MWGDRSKSRFDGVDPRLVQILELARVRSGIPFEISEGRRSADRQKELVASGKSQTMNSKHLTGNAVDVHIPDGNGGVNWEFDAYRPIAAAAKEAAAELGYNDFVWGGDWNTLKDGVHFQVGGSHAGHNHAPEGSPQGYTPGNYITGQRSDQQQANQLTAPKEREPFQMKNVLQDPRAFMAQPRNQLAQGGFDAQLNPFLSYLRNA